MSGKKKGSAYTKVLVITLVLALLAAASFVAAGQMESKKANRLSEMRAEVEEANQTAADAYSSELAEFRAQHADTGSNPAWPAPAGSGWEVVDLTSYPLEQPQTVTMSRADIMNNGLLLVNEWHSRPEDFSEDSLVRISQTSNGVIRVSTNTLRLLPNATQAWTDVLTAANVQHQYQYFMIDDAYRSYEDQEKLFKARMEKLASKYPDEAQLIEETKRYVNYPGTSEYNSGLTAHVRLYKSGDAEVNNKDSDFFASEEGLWLYEHSWEYGLVFRFPLADYPVKGTQDKSYKTGVSGKMKTFRFVGKGNAAAMHTMDLCLEEYIDYLAEHPHIAVYEDGVLRYEIVRQYVGDDDMVNVTTTGKGSVVDSVTSLDNMGYAVTVFSY